MFTTLAGFLKQVYYALLPEVATVTAVDRKALLKHSDVYRLATREQDPELIAIVDRLSVKAGLKKSPKVFIFESEIPHAFCLANGSLAIASSQFQTRSWAETESVLAHEITHKLHMLPRMAAIGAVLSGWLAATTAATHHIYKRAFPAGEGKDEAGNTLAVATIFAAVTAVLDRPFDWLYNAVRRLFERDADRGAAILTASADGLLSVLHKFEEERTARRNKPGKVIPSTSPSLPPASEWEATGPSRAQEEEKEKPSRWQKLDKELLRSHPTYERRIQQNERYKQQLASGELSPSTSPSRFH